ncbi:aminomethyl-transferring glycine dehydrogenase subunit GcvPA [Planctomycetota bacterium]
MPFVTNTKQQQQEMLREMGLTMEQLFEDIPKDLRCAGLDLPQGLSELEVQQQLEQMAAQNASDLVCFMGGGVYDHFIPAAINAITSRGEFYTAYTPYQPELSQGTLQAIYEYQSAICRLTEMEVSNASVYDGGTAIYEALMMARRATRKDKIIIDDSVNPIYREIVRTHSRSLPVELVEVANVEGQVNRKEILAQLDDKTAAVVVQNPNFFGFIDDFTDIAQAAHAQKALLIVSVHPLSLGILKTPGAMGADIATGEGQSLGIPMSFGGPYLGFIATRMAHVRKLPGRITGQTLDHQGRRGFVLTLQAREQHIRREKATSNICTNEALCALTALIYLSLVGKQGLKEIAQLCADKAGYAYQKLTQIPKVKPHFDYKWFFNEFVIDLPITAQEASEKLVAKGIAAGFPMNRYYKNMDNSMLIAVTEKRTKQQIDTLAQALEAVL